MGSKKVIVVGSGNAALCAGIAALEKGADVLMLEKADSEAAGGNSKYTAGAMRFVYNSKEDLLPLLLHPDDEKIAKTEFKAYSKEKFQEDLQAFNEGKPLTLHQSILIDQSYDTLLWLASHDIKFEPIYKRQTFIKDGNYIFWGGLTLAAEGEGVGLIEAEMKTFSALGGQLKYRAEAVDLLVEKDRVTGVKCNTESGQQSFPADAVILGCGGFEANPDLRSQYMGKKWLNAKVRGTPHNSGGGIEMALKIGAQFNGVPEGCHAVPMDLNTPDYGNLDIPYIDRKNYRKICYYLGVMLNANGERFVDEGINFRNYTYAQFGKAILNQPGNLAWQVFDSQVDALLYDEYRFWDVTCVEADSLEELIKKMEGIDAPKTLHTLEEYNASVGQDIPFDPTILDGKTTKGLKINKTNWANTITQPPFKAYPVTCGITFTYGGLKVDKNASVLRENDRVIDGLFACGELVGGVFYHGYPGGSGLTSGAVFGRLAGHSSAES